MPRTLLPEFLIIGAAKAATTWISHQLRQHPSAFLPETEPHFFSAEFHRGFDWYGRFFAGAEPHEKLGEKSADYLAHPQAAHRLAEVVPDARLVVQLRNPVERAYSDYCMLYRRGTVRGQPDAYFNRATTPQPRFLDDGLYRRHLDRFLDHFPRGQIKVILYEDLKARPEAVIADVCQHVGLPPYLQEDAIQARLNASEARMLPLGIRRALQPLKPVAKPLRGSLLFETLRSPLTRPLQYPPLERDTRQRLRDFYADDVAGLEQLLGRDLSGWLAEANAA